MDHHNELAMSDTTDETVAVGLGALLAEAERHVDADPRHALDLLDEVRRRAIADGDQRAFRHALKIACPILFATGRLIDLQQTGTVLVDLGRQHDDPAAEAVGTWALAVVAREVEAEPAEATRLGLQALRAAERAHDPSIQAMVLLALGVIGSRHGDGELASEHFREAAAAAVDADAPGTQVEALGYLARTHLDAGDLLRAEEVATEALLVAERNRLNTILVYRLLADVSLRAGNGAEAERQLRVALDADLDDFGRARLTDARHGVILQLAKLAVARREFEVPRHQLSRLASELEQSGGRRRLAEVYEALAAVHAASGDWQRAYKLHVRYHELARRSLDERADLRLRVLQIRNRNELLRYQVERARSLSYRDALTGVHNRRHLDERGAAIVARAGVTSALLGALLVDVDRFKAVNDRFGHLVGDQVLRIIADALASEVGDDGLVARYGGEEFVALLPGAPLVNAAAIAERVRARVEGWAWSELADGLSVTVSIGVAAETGPGSLSVLLAAADACLYEAKRAGRNRVLPVPSADRSLQS